MPISQRMISLYLRARLWLGVRRFESFAWNVVRVSQTRLIKGPCESAGLEGLKYVAQHTSIPAPKVHRTYSIDGRLYIEMEYIQGATLQELWTSHSLSPTEKHAIVKQVAACINELRLLQPPQEGAVPSAELGQGFDVRVGYHPFGPFPNIDDVHSFLRGQIPLENCTKVFSESVTQCHTRQYCTYFTHADLCPRNIIICDGKIAAIVDWQFAGWYPEYWEYTKANLEFSTCRTGIPNLKMPNTFSS